MKKNRFFDGSVCVGGGQHPSFYGTPWHENHFRIQKMPELRAESASFWFRHYDGFWKSISPHLVWEILRIPKFKMSETGGLNQNSSKTFWLPGCIYILCRALERGICVCFLFAYFAKFTKRLNPASRRFWYSRCTENRIWSVRSTQKYTSLHQIK